MKIAIIRVNKEWVYIVQVAGVDSERSLDVDAICALVEIVVVKVYDGGEIIIVSIVFYI